MSSVQTIEVHTAPAYEVTIGAGLRRDCGARLKAVLGGCRIAVAADSNVAPLYLETVCASLRDAGFAVCSYVFPAGEAYKNFTTLSAILEFLAESQLTRTDCVAALGGGVTGDMAGFAAASYLRGIRYVQLPTTLLSAVDSSVGGKTAIDLAAGKNLAGAFLQPAAVLCDTDCLRSLPAAVFADGAADFTIASRLNPNDWNVWYHLGLSYFLLGMYDKADWAYTRCAALNKTADDICAVTDWHYMTLKRLGKDEEAAKLLDEITEDMPVSDEVANSYYQRLRVYKGLRAPETLFTNAGDGAGLDVITQGFGVANYYRMNGQEEKGVEMLKKVVYTAEHSKWYAAFGCLAARVDLKNIGQA